MSDVALLSDPALRPTPSDSPGIRRRLADFGTLTEALEYAAAGETGMNFYSARGVLEIALPYRDLRTRAEDLGRRLAGLGIAPGDRVALLAATSPDFLAGFFACQYAGAIPVPMPLPTAFGRREAYIEQIKGQLRSSGARMIVGPAEFMPLVTEAGLGFDLLLVGTVEDIHNRAAPAGALPRAKTDELSYIQYSSGSTRFPTGVMVTHASLMANCRVMTRDGVRNESGDRGASWLPFFHDMGLVGFMLGALTSQTSMDYLPTEDFARRPLTWLKIISENGGTVSYAPSFGYELCARRVSTMAEGALGLDLSRWRMAGIGGEMIKPNVMQAFAEAFRSYGFSEKAFCASYGLAECVLAVSFSDAGTGMRLDHVDKAALEEHRAAPAAAGAPEARTFVSCGKVLPEHRGEIRDEQGNILGERQVGRLYVQGPSVMQGYFNDDEATREALIDGWLDTGDLAYWIGEELVIVGRAKDMMIINGRNVWPQDVEWTVEHIDGLRSGDSAAIVLANADGSDRPTVLVQCRASSPEDRRKLEDQVRAKVQEAVGVLCDVVLVPARSLPKTTSGKLARGRAKKMFEAGEIEPLDAGSPGAA